MDHKLIERAGYIEGNWMVTCIVLLIESCIFAGISIYNLCQNGVYDICAQVGIFVSLPTIAGIIPITIIAMMRKSIATRKHQ